MTDTSSDSTSIPEALQRIQKYPSAAVCPDSHKPGVAHCTALIRTNAKGMIAPLTTPSGFGPSDLKDAYKLPSTGGSGITVAIVDAQDDPSAEQDLATYRSTYGLPPCTTANGCFKKVNENGVQGSYPSPDQGWAGEIALDIEMVSATCPSCKILLVEATSANMDDLGKSVNTAVSLGATVVSNSYGGSEDSSIPTADSQYFNHPGVAIFVSAGDSGYGTEYPASSQYVTAVGGTALARSTGSSRGWVESVWGTSSGGNGTGSGCSAYIAKPSWQQDTGCSKRMVGDVSAVADPNTGVAVYDSYGSGGWNVYGGTSVASPVVAGIYALTNHVSDSLGYAYSHASQFFDVTSGSNGSCSPSYFCKAQTGYDGPTGLGTPNGAALAGGGTTSNDFSLTINPTSVSLAQGTSKTVAVSTSVTSGNAESISLSVSGLPSGVTGSFSPATVTAGGSSTLTITASSSASVTSTSFSVNGSSASASHAANGTVSVTSSGGGGGGTLSNGVPVTNLSGATGSQQAFTMVVPSGATNLSFQISGGTGDADLYVKFGSAPTLSSYDCRPYVTGNNETCNISNVQAGTYYVMLNGYAAYSGVTLEGSYSTGGGGGGGTTLTNGVPVSNLSSSGQLQFTMVVPSGATNLSFKISGGSGDADLYVKFGSAPTTSSYDCRPYVTGNNETCNISNVQAGTYYVMLNAYSAFSGVTLVGSYSTGGGGGGGNVLVNGVPVTIAGASGSSTNYTFPVSAPSGSVTVSISGGSGDADLYVKFGSAPTTSSYDCRPYLYGNNETCTLTGQAGTYYVMVHGYQSYSGVSLVGSY